MAEGIQGLVLDVKWGSGAFMKTRERAEELARRLCAIGRTGGKHVVAMVTDMNQPLGRFIGNSLEVEECVAILKREGLRGRKLSEFHDCEELSVQLAGVMIWLGGKVKTVDGGVSEARRILDSGEAFKKFEQLVIAQGGDLLKLPRAEVICEVLAMDAGTIASIDTEQIGYAALVMGAGRRAAGDKIDPVAGIECLIRLGERVEKGQPLYRLYGKKMATPSAQNVSLSDAMLRLQEATVIDKSLQSFKSEDLIASRIGFE